MGKYKRQGQSAGAWHSRTPREPLTGTGMIAFLFSLHVWLLNETRADSGWPLAQDLFPGSAPRLAAADPQGAPLAGSALQTPALPRRLSIDLRRASDCEALLTRLDMNVQEVMDAIISMDGKRLGREAVQRLLGFIPTKACHETNNALNTSAVHPCLCQSWPPRQFPEYFLFLSFWFCFCRTRQRR